MVKLQMSLLGNLRFQCKAPHAQFTAVYLTHSLYWQAVLSLALRGQPGGEVRHESMLS